MAEYTKETRDWGSASLRDYCFLLHFLGEQGFVYGVAVDGKIKRWYAICPDESVLRIDGHPDASLGMGKLILTVLSDDQSRQAVSALESPRREAYVEGYGANTGPEIIAPA